MAPPLLLMMGFLWVGTHARDLPPPCDSNIYCTGQLLHTIQMAHIFPDSKHFVDMPMRNSSHVILDKFQRFMARTKNGPSKRQVEEFVSENFDEPGSEFEDWDPEDWTDSPSVLENISDPAYRSWAAALNGLWKVLGRRISPRVKESPHLFSQIHVEHPVVVPGGRFREFYYWDSYWTIDGLLLCDMKETVKGMLENFMQLVDKYGMVPNGGRIYYTRRSQPPYAIPMMKLYVDATDDWDFIRKHADNMEKELMFWIHQRSRDVNYRGKAYMVAQYNVQVDGPRPESYREDYEVAMSVPAPARSPLYVEYKSGAESGWDYSSRWIVNGDSNRGDLKHLGVTSILPVDLNSLLCYNAKVLSDFYAHLGDESKRATYSNLHLRMKASVHDLFWDEEDGTWYDRDAKSLKRRKYFYQSNLHPLWTGCFNESQSTEVVDKVVQYLKKNQVMDYIGGVPTSKLNSGQQWDFPNAWAPLQHLFVMGLRNVAHLNPEAGDMARNLSKKWIESNYRGYRDTKAMFEKYNIELRGAPGGGGEYDVQAGFGWTNGVALRLLNDFPDLEALPDSAGDALQHSVALVLLAAVAAVRL